MELTIFGRFHARAGQAPAVAGLIVDVVLASGEEPGCLSIRAYRSPQDKTLFFIHSVWVDEAAFDVHAGLPHTVRFLEAVQPLIDHPLDIQRTRPIGS